MADIQLLPVAPTTPAVGDSVAPKAADAPSGESFGQALTQAKDTSGEKNHGEGAKPAAREAAQKNEADRADKAATKAAAKANKAKHQARKHLQKDAKAVEMDVPKLPISRRGDKTGGEGAKPLAPAGPAAVPENTAKPSTEGAATEVINIWRVVEGDAADGQWHSIQVTEGDDDLHPTADATADQEPTDEGNGQTEAAVSTLIGLLAGSEALITVTPLLEIKTDAEEQEDPLFWVSKRLSDDAKASVDATTIKPRHGQNEAADAARTAAQRKEAKEGGPAGATITIGQDQIIKVEASDTTKATGESPTGNQAPQQADAANAANAAKGNLSLLDAAKALPPSVTIVEDAGGTEPDFELRPTVQDAAPAKAPQAPQAAPLLIESALPKPAPQTKDEAAANSANRGEGRAVPDAALEGKATAIGGEAVKGVSAKTAESDWQSTTAQVPKEATGETKPTQKIDENAASRAERDTEAAEATRTAETAKTTKTTGAPEKPRTSEQAAPSAQPVKGQRTDAKADAPVDGATRPTALQNAPAENAERAEQTARQDAAAKQSGQATSKADAPAKQTGRTTARTNATTKPIAQPDQTTARPDAPARQPGQTKVQPDAQAKETNAPNATNGAGANANTANAPAERPGHASEAIERAKPSPQQMNMSNAGPNAIRATEAADGEKDTRAAKSFENATFRADVNLGKDSAAKGFGGVGTADAKAPAGNVSVGHSENHFAATHSSADVSGAAPKQPVAPAVHRQFLPPQAPMSQLEGSVRWLLRSGAKGAELQLHPENLGRVTVQLKVEGSDVHAKVWASEASTMPLLKEHRAFLESSLKEQGLTLGSFDLQHGKGGHQAQGEADRHHQHFAPPMMETWTGTEFRQEMPTQLVAQHIDESGADVYA